MYPNAARHHKHRTQVVAIFLPCCGVAHKLLLTQRWCRPSLPVCLVAIEAAPCRHQGAHVP